MSSPPETSSSPALPTYTNAIEMWVKHLFCSSEWKLRMIKDGVRYYKRPSPFMPKPNSGVYASKLQVFVPGVHPADVEKLLLNQAKMLEIEKHITKKEQVHLEEDAAEGMKKKEKEKEVPMGSSVTELLFHTLYQSPMWGVWPRDMVTRVVPSYWMKSGESSQQGEVVARLGIDKVVLETGGAKDGEVIAPEKVLEGLEVTCYPTAATYFHVGRDASHELPGEKGYQRAQVHCFGYMAQHIPELQGTLVTNCFSLDLCGYLPKALMSMNNMEQIEKMRVIRDTLTASGNGDM